MLNINTLKVYVWLKQWSTGSGIHGRESNTFFWGGWGVLPKHSRMHTTMQHSLVIMPCNHYSTSFTKNVSWPKFNIWISIWFLTHMHKQLWVYGMAEALGRPAVYRTFSTNHLSYTKTLVPIYLFRAITFFWWCRHFLRKNGLFAPK